MEIRTRMSKEIILKDILAGITVGIIALPLALAFGVASGLGPEAGIYGAIGTGFFAALLGGTRTQVSGPTGPITIVTATIVASYADRLGIVFAIFMLAGLFQILFGFLRLGKIIQYVPYPVMSGFMNGISLIIISQQLIPLIGYQSPSGFLDIMKKFPTLLNQINWIALVLGIATIAIIYIAPKFIKIVPATLISLILISIITFFLNLDVPLIGEVPRGFPSVALPKFNWADLPNIIVPALTLGALGCIDSLLTSILTDKITPDKHNSNRELVGQGIGNIIAAAIGGIPGSGATMRTVANIKAGGSTRLSGAVHSLFLLFVVLALGKFASFIPNAVLAGILITVGIGIFDYEGLKDVKIIPKYEILIITIVCLLTLFTNLLLAVAVGFIISKIFLVVSLNHSINRFLLNNEFIHAINEKENLLVQKYHGPLFFGISNNFHDTMINKLIDINPQITKVIFEMDEISYIDQSGLYGLVAICKDFSNYKVKKIFIIPPDNIKNALQIKIKEQHLEDFVCLNSSYEEAFTAVMNPETAIS